MIETIRFKDKQYLKLQSEGFASQYAFPFAKKIIGDRDVIYDIGFGKDFWKYPNSIGVDLTAEDGFDAMNLPPMQADCIFSSHLLEHLPNYVDALKYWHSKLKKHGILFLYLPHCGFQEYWMPWSNRKHIHLLTPWLMQQYFHHNADLWTKVFVTDGYDLNGSFYCVAEKI
jgi:predicted SAM-dependent methyltransferase